MKKLVKSNIFETCAVSKCFIKGMWDRGNLYVEQWGMKLGKATLSLNLVIELLSS